MATDPQESIRGRVNNHKRFPTQFCHICMVPIRIFASKFPNVQYEKIGIIIIVMSRNLDLILALAKVATNYTAVC